MSNRSVFLKGRVYALAAYPSLLLLLAIWPYLVQVSESSFNGYRLLELIFLATLFFLAAIQKSLLVGCSRLIYGFFVLAILSIVGGEFPLAGAQELGRIAMVVLAVCYFRKALGEEERQLSILMLLVPAAAFSVFLFFEFIFQVFYLGQPYFEIIGFKNRRQFNDLQVLLLPLMFSVFSFDVVLKSRLLSFSVVIIFTIWVVSLLQSGARGGLLSIALAYLIIRYFCMRDVGIMRLERGLLKVLLIACVTYSIYYIWSLFVAPESETLIRGGSSGRLRLWSDVLLSGEVSLLGNGPQSYVAFSMDRYPSHPFGTPHNWIIALLYEHGIVGLSCVLGLVFIFARRIYSLKGVVISGARFGGIWALLAFMIYALFAGINYSSFSGILIPLIFACAFPLTLCNEKILWSQRLFGITFCLLGLFYLCYSAYWMVFQSCEIGPVKCDGTTIPMTYPRFFERGGYFLLDHSS